ncbi:MAG: class I SAM-dependent methyltransferase [Gemmatimonadaceae bacterium]
MSEKLSLTAQTFRELAAFREDDPACHALLQFRRQVTAYQYQRLYELVDRYLRPHSQVLDWGSGNGHVSYGLWRRGFRVSGFSFEDFGVRRHLDASYKFKQGNEDDPSRLPFDSDAFDAVMSVGVLEHVRETGGNELASLREIARVLKPGGAFICYHFPNKHSVIEAMARRSRTSHSHKYLYGRADIATLCDQTGLKLLEVKRYGALPRNIWHRTPPSVGNSGAAVTLWNTMDSLLGALLPRWTQNYLFVARKR